MVMICVHSLGMKRANEAPMRVLRVCIMHIARLETMKRSQKFILAA